ncbi:MAG: TRAP transporter small permease [Gemmatimonadetes bacterium]|jgi:C4-dicarboxylate transporter, DctQ subunit|nr:TRAP transporter small permease [Gemmatimonadota bacterium]MBT7858660.1 TRAP transporter small permease [Gemmatimonadota bacterium]
MSELTQTSSTESGSRLRRVEDGVLLFLVGLLVVLSCAQILLRNLFELTYFWLEPLTRHLVLWSSFLGALVATREGQHIRIDAVLRLLPPIWRRRATTAGEIIAATVCALLGLIALRFVADERTYGGEIFLGLPQWSVQIIFPIVFLFMALRFLVAAWRRQHQ